MSLFYCYLIIAGARVAVAIAILICGELLFALLRYAGARTYRPLRRTSPTPAQ